MLGAGDGRMPAESAELLAVDVGGAVALGAADVPLHSALLGTVPALLGSAVVVQCSDTIRITARMARCSSTRDGRFAGLIGTDGLEAPLVHGSLGVVAVGVVVPAVCNDDVVSGSSDESLLADDDDDDDDDDGATTVTLRVGVLADAT
jgi:hypothetical protein